MVEYARKESYGIDDLLEIVGILRGKGGCPWDMEQTHASIRNGFIEEVYEAVEAIDTGDTVLLREELGDVLLQVAFHCRIEEEIGGFKFADVCDEICKKLILRHPHVFSDVVADGTDEVLKNWDNIKMKTKGQQSYTDSLRDVSKSLPALMRAQKVGKRADRAGLKQGLGIQELGFRGDCSAGELGDLLFACANAARELGHDAEELLNRSTDKFIERFAKTEELTGSNMKDMKID